MPYHIPLERLIDEKVVESNRIEYKSSWNPLKVLHTMCAFANDLENASGGYIIIGIREQDGKPAEVLGVSDSEAKKIEDETQKLSNLTSPYYSPIVSRD